MSTRNRTRSGRSEDVCVRLPADLWQAIEAEAALNRVSGARCLADAVTVWTHRHERDVGLPVGLGALSRELEDSAGSPDVWLILFGDVRRPYIAMGTLLEVHPMQITVDLHQPESGFRGRVLVPRADIRSWQRVVGDPIACLCEACDPCFGPDTFYVRHLLWRVPVAGDVDADSPVFAQ